MRNVSTVITAVVMQAFVFAVEYGVDVDVTAATMVLCTILGAPVMFVSAKVQQCSLSYLSFVSCLY